MRTALLAALIALASPAPAADLLMFRADDCAWCAAWERDVGVVYPRTAEGRSAPLRRLEIDGPRPAGISLAAPVRYTPTFVLVERGREVGRITGYPGESNFWGLLGQLLARQK